MSLVSDATNDETALVLDDTLAAPFTRLDEAAAIDLAARHWGFVATSARRLATERDDTFALTAGDQQRVIKVAHPLDDPDVIDFQCSALTWATNHDPAIPLATLYPTLDGAPIGEVRGADGETRLGRLLSYLTGDQLLYDQTSAEQRRAIGSAQARLSLALSGFEHRAADRYVHFDLKQLSTIRPLLTFVEDPRCRDNVESILDAFDDSIGAALAATGQQVVHHDMNADNVLVDYTDDAFVTGILDFGDAVHSSIVGDLGSAMCYAVDAGAGDPALPPGPDPWAAPADLAVGFLSVRDLPDDEVALLPDLVRVRLAQRMILNSWLATTDPSNAGYTGRTIARATRALQRVIEIPPTSLDQLRDRP